MSTLQVGMTTKLVLLVDDEAHVREVVEACLKDLGGWNVQSVASVDEGLDKLAFLQPDAIILDISMPGMDGFMFLRQLRANPLTQSIPVVFLTARARWFTLQQLRPFGVVGAIAKPFNPVSLTKDIGIALGWYLEAQN